MAKRAPAAPAATLPDDASRISLGALKPDAENARKHNPRNMSVIEDSLQKVGFARSIVIDEDNVILAGNGVAEAAGNVGMERVRVIEANGDEVIAVRRRGLTAGQKKALALADNRANELSTWDTDVLASLHERGELPTGLWSSAEFWQTLRGVKRPGKTDPDDLPPAREVTVKKGDVYQCGRHVAACGDATDPVHIGALLKRADGPIVLMATDPPYGVNYQPTWRDDAGLNRWNPSVMVGEVLNDDRVDWAAAIKLFPGPVIYLWHAGLYASDATISLKLNGFEIRAQIIWEKQLAPISRGHYHWQHEPCWYAVRKGETGQWQGDRKQTTVWAIPNLNPLSGNSDHEDHRLGHGTQKPVALFEKPIENHTLAGAWVYDPFVGSGTMLIAAERLGRRAIVNDLDPAYLQMTLDRWSLFTGQTPVRQ
jgi:DNA modification methylase